LRSINPYQNLLAAALERQGISVRFPDQFGQRRPLLTALLSRQFDVLHLDWIHPYVVGDTYRRSVFRSTTFLLKVCLVRLLRRRIIWTVHNLVSHEARFRGWERRVNGLLARLAHGLVVHYPSAQEIVRKDFRVRSGKEVLVAFHGHYVGAYGDANAIRSDMAPQESPPRPLVFLAFGLVRRYKRLEELITAFKTIDRADVRLTIRGQALDVEYGEELQRLAAEDDRIRLDLEFVDDEKVAAVFAAADVVALTQTDMLTSGSLILAMSMGMPVVAARGPHAEFLLGHGEEGGVLYTAGSVTELADALQQMLDRRQELPKMGLANKRKIAPYTWSAMAEEMERAYRGSD
jgi:glycosyltransferase involved in cell wall biosynthesis